MKRVHIATIAGSYSGANLRIPTTGHANNFMAVPFGNGFII